MTALPQHPPITIKTYDGNQIVQPLYVTPSGKLAVHPMSSTIGLVEYLFSITHIPSGLTISPEHFDNQDRLIAIADELDALDWDFPGAVISEETFRASVQIWEKHGFESKAEDSAQVIARTVEMLVKAGYGATP